MKINYRHIVLYSWIILTYAGCKKPEDRTCFKSFGNPSSKIIEFSSLSTIDVYDDISLNLIQDSLNYLEIKDYKNTIKDIEVTFDSGELSIKNNTSCKIFRTRKKHPSINLHFSSIKKLNLYGSGNINSVTTWSQDSIDIFSEEAAATLALDVKANDVHLYLKNGAIDGAIKGSSQSVYCYQSGYSLVQLNELITPYLHFAAATTGDVKVYSSSFLHIELWNTGNVFYYGNPTNILITEQHRTGKLIKG